MKLNWHNAGISLLLYMVLTIGIMYLEIEGSIYIYIALGFFMGLKFPMISKGGKDG